jgi:hypothetical protein
MCDERERLIGYVYDECDRAERREIEAHVSGCADCREEIGGLRSVRQDLLAWDVPPHGSVWQPFVRPRIVGSWRDVPSWALAAAAAAIFVAGAAGGLATRVLWPAPALAVARTVPAATMTTPVAAAVTPADLETLKASLLNQLRTEMDQRVVAMAAHETPATTAPQIVQASTGANPPTRAALDAMSERMADFERWQRNQIALNVEFDRRMGLISSRTTRASDLLELNRQAWQRVSLEVGQR